MSSSRNGKFEGLEKSEVDEIVHNFKEIYQSTLRLVAAKVQKSNRNMHIVESEWSQRNLQRGRSMKISRTQLTDSSLNPVFDIGASDASEWILSAFSKTEKYKAAIQSVPSDSSKGDMKFYLEIWSWSTMTSISTYDLAALDVHGPVYSDDRFGSLSWSNKENKVIYIAEKKKPKAAPFYQQKLLSDNDDSSKNESDIDLRGEQYVYEEDWGETLSPKQQPVIVCCDIMDEKLSLVRGIPQDISPAEVVFEPNDEGIVGVGFINTPRRLGLVHCSNKESHIFYLSHENYVILSDKNVAVASPRFSPDGKYLVWLQRSQGGPHHTAVTIVRCDWSTKKITVVVDVVQDNIITRNGKEFFGVFTHSFATRCWTPDSKYLLFSTAQKYRINTYAVDIDTGALWDIGSKNEKESNTILDVSDNNFALLSITSFKQPHCLSSLYIPSVIGNTADEPLLQHLTEQENISEGNIIEYFDVLNTSAKENCYATYYGPQSEQKQSTPLVLYLHGGPHASSSSSFSPTFHLFTQLGFGVLTVHYHGSTGIGQKFNDSLLGEIASLDIEDCYSALQTGLKKFPWLDPNRVLLFGGSYGGFLVLHLSSCYPDTFIGVVAINPVVNLPCMLYTTDIPEWVTVTSGFPYEGLSSAANNPDLYEKMMEKSPIKNVNKVKIPTLLLIGKKDLRVPSSQGIAYYHALKERNIPAKLHFYDDNHSLGTVPVEMDAIINTAIWFKRCLKRVE